MGDENKSVRTKTKIEILTTSVFTNFISLFNTGKYNGYVLEGGSRSSKTWSIIQFWIYYATIAKKEKKDRRVFISRAVGTWITGSVLNDFLKIARESGLSEIKEYSFNKTVRILKLWTTEFWFFGLDDTQKIHGMTSDAFWINEAIEAKRADFDQLEQRCSGFFILDYNPSTNEHWIFDNVCKRNDVSFQHSTMLDNDFLPENMKRKILSYEPTDFNFEQGTADKNKWDIYGLGIRSMIEGLVFNPPEIIAEIPPLISRRFTGIDFGYTNDVTAIPEVAIHENSLYINELCYQTYMLTRDIIKTLKDVNNDRKIWSESADPRMVDEIYNAGFNIHSVVKGPGSIMAGIDKMKSMKIYITENSVNAIREFKNYTYKKDKNDNWLNEPIDDFNHIIDAVRYVVLMELLGRNLKSTAKEKASYFGR